MMKNIIFLLSPFTDEYITLEWAGDQTVDFSYGDGLLSTISAALNI